jgi:hypothetical protein
MRKASRFCYVLLVLASIAFVMTVMAFTLLPWDSVPPWLKENLLPVILLEVGAIIVLGLLSMGLDKTPTAAPPTLPPADSES